MHWYFVATSSPNIGYGHVARLKLLAAESTLAFPKHQQSLLLDAQDDDPSNLAALRDVDSEAIVVVDGPDSFVDTVTSLDELRNPSVLVAAFRMYGVREDQSTLEDVSLVPSFAPSRLERRPNGFVYSGRRLIMVRRSLFAGVGDARLEPPRVLVTMGSADPSDLTTLAAEALVGLEARFRITLVVGALNRRADELRARYSELYEVMSQQGADFDSLLRSASMAVVSGGLTRYECVAAKTPFVSISLNEQQAKYTSAVTEAGFGIHAGVHGTVTEEQVRAAFLRLADDPAALDRMRHAAAGMLAADNPYELARFLHAASIGVWGSR